MSSPYPLRPPDLLTSDDGHRATVMPVKEVNGRFEGKWQLRIERAGQKTKVLYADATPRAVREKMAKYLDLPFSSITTFYGDPNSENASSTPGQGQSAKIPVSLSTEYGHHGAITPMRKYSKMIWELNLEGPMSPFGGSPSVMRLCVGSDPSEQAAAKMASEFFHVSQEEIMFHYDNDPTTPVDQKKEHNLLTPSNKPLDKFEFSPNSRATCHECHERISKDSQRVGIQEWNGAFKHWQPVYYHRECCTNDMLQSLDLGGKRKREDDSTASGSVESKLKAELDRQDTQEKSKRCLVYGKRHGLREDLRRMRMELATQLEVEPYKIFNDAALDDIVAKLPSNEKELIKCRGIAQRRCDHYGGAILQIMSQYREMNPDE